MGIMLWRLYIVRPVPNDAKHDSLASLRPVTNLVERDCGVFGGEGYREAGIALFRNARF